jgi:hypothetical protein
MTRTGTVRLPGTKGSNTGKKLLTEKMGGKNSPELSGPELRGGGLVVPAEVVAAVAAERQAPTVSGKPGVGLGRLRVSNGTGTGEEGMKVALHPRRVNEVVSRLGSDADEAVGRGNEAAAGNALVGLGAVAADSV